MTQKSYRNSEDIMAEDALTAVSIRNAFYRDGQRKIILILLISMIANVVFGSILFYIITHPPLPKYFATSINGRITPLFPLNEPNQSDSAVLQWANQAAIAAFSYNFVNYRSELQAASGFFTANGWTQFLNALQDSNNLEAVKAKKLIVSAVATRAPIILQKGVLNDRYSWRVQMPILVTYQSASEFTQQNNVVTMLITRVSTLNSPRGIGISQFVVGPASGEVGG
nr:type IVB secretion system apparatus protein IcmL/DotI [Legionella impletisoli]